MTNIRTKFLFYLIFSLLGLADAFYLSWVKIQNTELFCGGSTNCETVNSSKYANLFGVPVAFLGFVTYIAIIVFLFLGKKKLISKEIGTFVLFGITLIGTLFSVYLTYIEIYVIDAICPYCLVSAIIMLLLFVLAIYDLIKMVVE
jgi:uncharacterized membrane protein